LELTTYLLLSIWML